LRKKIKNDIKKVFLKKKKKSKNAQKGKALYFDLKQKMHRK